MDKIQEKAYFNIGNSEYYEGYHIKDERWNGWARPYFEKCRTPTLFCKTVDYNIYI